MAKAKAVKKETAPKPVAVDVVKAEKTVVKVQHIADTSKPGWSNVAPDSPMAKGIK